MQYVTYTNEHREIIDFDSFNSPFILQSIEGTGNVKANHRTTRTSFQHGNSRKGTNLEPRYLVLRGTINTCDRRELARLKQIFCSIFNPALNDGKLTYDAGNGTKFIYAITEETPIFSEYNGDNVQFIVNLVANDPFWHDEEYEQYIFETPYNSLFQFPQSFSTPNFQMGTKSIVRTFINKGDIEAPLILEFVGGVKDVKFHNKTTGEWIEFKKKLHYDNMLIVNSTTGEKEITIIDSKGNKENGYCFLTVDCVGFINLAKGENVIEFTAQPDLSTNKVKMKWLTNYLGV